MADKNTDKYLSLYPEDVSDNVWESICGVLCVPIVSPEVRIYFKPTDIVYLNEIQYDDGYEEDENEDEIHISSFEIEA